MIIDGHAYCFPPRDEAAGYSSVEEKWLEFQRELSGHHQPVWRVRDRAPADNSTLIDPETKELRDVQFTVHRNRITWDYQGETYTKQYYPPMLYRGDAPAELLVTEMDYAGVDMALLHTSTQLGRLNDYLADAASQYPDRLKWLVNIPEAHILDDPDAAMAEATRWLATDGAAGYQFHAKFYYLGGNTEPWDGESMRPFWDAIATPGSQPSTSPCWGPVTSHDTPLPRGTPTSRNRESLGRWMERYPDVNAVITHGFPWRSYVEDNSVVLTDDLWDVFEAPQCHLQLLFAIQLGNLFEYPWTETEAALQQCVERIGADRLIYGTDMPMVGRFCTYRQTLGQYLNHCDFLTDSERQARSLGGTAARLMGIDRGAAER